MLRFGALVLLNQSSFKPAEGSSLQSLAISLPSFRPLELNCALSSLPRLSSWAICSPSMSKEALRESVQVHEGVRAKRQRSDCIICRVHRLSPCPFDQKMSLPPVAPSTSPDPNPKSCSVPRVGARKYVTFLLVFPRWRKQIRRDGGKERANVFFFGADGVDNLSPRPLNLTVCLPPTRLQPLREHLTSQIPSQYEQLGGN